MTTKHAGQYMAREGSGLSIPVRDPQPRVVSSVEFVRANLGRMSDTAIMRSLGLRRQSDFMELVMLAARVERKEA